MKSVGYGHSDPGKKREQNEDAFAVDDNLGAYVLCDGVGGHNAGEVASQTAVKLIREHLELNADVIQKYSNDPSAENRTRLLRLAEEAVQEACGAIWRMAEKDADKAGMATTCELVVVAGKHAVLAHVGDSRVYLNRAGQTHQLTEDHSFVVEQLKKGLMTPEQAKRSPFAHVITRALGLMERVEVDTLHLELLPGDALLLCSDGISDYMQGGEFAQILKQNKVPAAAQAFTRWANEQGGKDNSTAVVIHVEGKESTELNAEHAAKMEAMRKIPLFRHMTYQELIKILNIAGVKQYGAGQTIISEGAPGDELFILVAGTVSVTKRGQNLATLQRGSFFGEMQLIDSAPRSATILAIDAVKTLTFSREKLFPLLRAEAQLSAKIFWEFCQVLNNRLRTINELFVGSKTDGEITIKTYPFVTAEKKQAENPH
jgi:serine/threonine protein phosphatase PrpC